MFIGFTSIMNSCKKDTNSGGSGTGNGLTLTLSKSVVSLSNPENVYLTVKDQNNTDVTTSCTFTVNGAAFSSSVFAPTVAGTFKFIATKGTATSAEVSLVVTPVVVSTDSVFVSLSSPTLEFNNFDYISITVADKFGADITSSSQIYLDGVNPISNKYVADALGSHVVTAKRNGSPSNAKTLTVITKSPSPFTQKLLMEDCTGAWCGYCPRVANSLENYKSTHPNCIVVAVHGGGGTDPYKYQYYTTFNSNFGISGYPTAIMNRTGAWSENTSELNTALASWAPLGLAIESTTGATSVTGKVKVKYNVTTDRAMKVVVALVENGLVYPQTNYYSSTYGNTPYLYGGVSPVTNFVHNGVLRKVATDLFGDVIPVASQTKNNIYELPFTISLSGVTSAGASFTANASNSTIVAFVLDGTTDNNGVYNVQSAAVGTIKNFD